MPLNRIKVAETLPFWKGSAMLIADVFYCMGGQKLDLYPDDQLWTYAGFDVIGDALVIFFVDQVIPDAEVRYSTVIMASP